MHKQERERAGMTKRIILAGLALVILGVLVVPRLLTGRPAGSAQPEAVLQAVNVKATVSAGQVSISADELRKNKFVAFSYAQGSTKVPLLAYVGPDGELVVAVRMCEPCRSESFHIEGDEIVCDTCGSRWKIQDLQGVSGGCTAYPPEKLSAQESNGRLVISEETLRSWRPRI